MLDANKSCLGMFEILLNPKKILQILILKNFRTPQYKTHF
jgi:hypothetical protein